MPAGDKQPKKSAMGRPAKSLKAKTLESEKQSAEYLGGRPQPVSGALSAHKGDIKLDDFLIDKKETAGASILVAGKDLTKITREADGEGRCPALLIQIDQLPMTGSNEWVLLPIEKFAEVFK